VLQQLEFEAQTESTQSEIIAIGFDDWRSAYARPDEPLGGCNLLVANGGVVMHVFYCFLIWPSQVGSIASPWGAVVNKLSLDYTSGNG
jgi:hypothetical protein